ncbi:MAG: hypothetical protein AAGA84_11100, partial [Pseudomonadota bacterium]
ARLESRWADAQRFYQRALDIDPSDVTANLWYAEHLQDIGLVDKMIEFSQIAIQLDPLSPGANANLADGYLSKGDCDALATVARKATALGHRYGTFAPILCSASSRRWNDMLALVEADIAQMQSENDPIDEGALAFRNQLRIFAAADSPASRAAAKQMLVDEVYSWSEDPAAVSLLIALDRADLVVEYLSKQEQVYWGGFTKSFWGPSALPLRERPEFMQLLERSGLLKYYQQSGITPDDCRWQGESLDCTKTAANEPI